MASILVIEDDGVVRDALNVFLTRAGHIVETAADGGSGVTAFKRGRHDLVILDRNLPVMSGSGVFSAIRAADPQAKVLILSGYDDPEEMEIYLRHGAAAFLSKSDGLSNVLEAVEATLASAPRKAPRAAAAAQPAREASRAETRLKEAIRPLVLVADDEKIVRDILRRALSETGFEVLEARDGEEAERLAREKKPDIVLLDVFMPAKDGMQVLRELAPEMPGSGFMVMTGYGEDQMGREALGMGAFDYVTKPLNIDSLLLTMRARLLQQGKAAPAPNWAN